MHATMVRTTVPMLLVLTLALSFAGIPPTPQASSAPRIEGTYQLIARQFPDGTMLRPPDIMGLITYTKTHRNVNIVRKDATGKFTSFSSVSTYTLTATEYTETILFSIRTDQIGEKTSSTPSQVRPAAPLSRGTGGASSSRCRSSRARWSSRATR